VILRDDNGLSSDNMQMLSYYLCFLYVRCIKSISIPTPVMYAHLAAKRAKAHIVARDDDNASEQSGGRRQRMTDEERAEHESRMIADLNERVKVNELLKSKLYYC
jgi:hypothetical protein